MMKMRTTRTLATGLTLILLAACGGGGGGGGGDPAPIVPPPVQFPSALEFRSPISFVNGEAYVTEASLVSITGLLNSTFIPRGFCPDSPPPQNYSVRWTNAANGQSGTAPIGIVCVTIVGVPGIRSQFITDTFGLVMGTNRISIDTFEGSTQIGHDEIRIIREDNFAPRITSKYPADGQQDIPTNHAVVVIFSEAMNTSTLNADRFVVLDSSDAPVNGQVFYEAQSRAWTFSPAGPLASGSTYTATVSGTVADEGGNNVLGDDVTWSFSAGAGADVDAPSVEQQWPGIACDCSPVTTRILAGLSEFANPASVTRDTMSVTAAGLTVSGRTVYRGDYLEFIPDADLTPGLTYTVAVSGAVRDFAGQSMAIDYSWQFTTDARAAAGSWSETSQDQPPPGMTGATAVWTGTDVLIWGPEGGGVYDAATDAWSVTSNIAVGGPPPRIDHSAVWTGTEMIVWGGRSFLFDDAEIFNGGGSFDPVANAWSEIVAPDSLASYATFDHVAVWTGTEVIVWGGTGKPGGSTPQPVNSGWRYNPATGVVTAFRGDNPPSPRASAHAVWTGVEMIVWGGFDAAGSPLNDGARYDPVADGWTPLPPAGASLVPGPATSAVWTGTEMIVWNGGQTEADQKINDRFREVTLHIYDPLQDAWRISGSGWEPFLADSTVVTSNPSRGYLGFWTGDRMFVAGLRPGDRSYLYDPLADSWQVTPEALRIARNAAAAVWAGSRFVIWGGAIFILPENDGLVFQP